jgi:hypothetical protein
MTEDKPISPADRGYDPRVRKILKLTKSGSQLPEGRGGKDNKPKDDRKRLDGTEKS